MKKYLHLLILILVCSNLKSQDIKINFSESISLDDFNRNYPSKLTENEKDVYLYFYQKKTFNVVKLNRKELTLSPVMTVKRKSKNDNFNAVRFINNKIYLFTEEYNKSKEMQHYFVSVYSLGGEVEIENKILFENEVKKTNDLGEYIITLSPDSNSMIIFNVYNSTKKEDKEHFEFKIFNIKDIELTHNVEAELPYIDKDIIVDQILINNHKKVWIKYTLNDKELKENFTKLYFYNTDESDDIDEINLVSYKPIDSEKTIYFSQWNLSINDDENLFGIAYYGNKTSGNYGGIKGLFTLILDGKTKTPIQSKFKEISEFYSNSNIKYKKLINTNNHIYLISEIEYVDIYSYTTTSFDSKTRLSSTQYHTTSTYTNNNIFITKITKDGNIEKTINVPKSQSVEGTNLYSSFISNETFPLRFVYLVEMNTEGNNSFNRMTSPKLSTVALSEVDEDGKITSYPLFSNIEIKKYYVIPKLSMDIKYGELLLIGNRSNNIKFINLTY